MSETQKLWAFTVYSIAYEALVWGIFAYAVFWQGHAGWWFFAAIVLSGVQLRPKYFGLPWPPDDKTEAANGGGE